MAVERGNGSLRRTRIIASNRPQRPVFPVLHPLNYAKWKLWQSAVKHSLNEVKRNYPQHAREVEEYLHGYQENGAFHPGIVTRLSAEDKETRTHAVAEMKRLFARADLGRAASTTWPFMTPGERHLASDAKTTLGKFSRMPGLAKRLVIYTLAAAQIAHMAPSAAVTTREALQNWLAKKPAIEQPVKPTEKPPMKPIVQQKPNYQLLYERLSKKLGGDEKIARTLNYEVRNDPEGLEIRFIGANLDVLKNPQLRDKLTTDAERELEFWTKERVRGGLNPDPTARDGSPEQKLGMLKAQLEGIKIAAIIYNESNEIQDFENRLTPAQKSSISQRQTSQYGSFKKTLEEVQIMTTH